MPPVELFAVQAYVHPGDYGEAEAFRRKTAALFDEVEALRERGPGGEPRHPALVVFPEMYGAFTCLAGFGSAVRSARTIDGALARIALRSAPSLIRAMVTRRVGPKLGFLLARAASVRALWAGTFAELARRHRVVVVAGSALLPDDERARRVHNVSYAFGPDGRLLDRTRKVNLVPTLEDALGLSPGAPDAIIPFDAGFARVGTLVCYDGFREPHTAREPCFSAVAQRHAEQGARILAQPSANPWPWEERWVFAAPGETQLRREQWLGEGLYAQLPSLAGVRYVVNPMLVGQLFDQRFDGRSYIFERSAEGAVRIAAAARRADLAPESEEVVRYLGEV